MALWLFRRRSGRKRPRSGATHSDAEGGPPSSPDGARASSKKKRRTEPPRPPHPTRTYSFEPGQQDALRLDRERAAQRKRLRKEQRNRTPVQDDSTGAAWDRTPTLQKTTKRRKRRDRNDRKEMREREAQIKAMVDFEPVRPAAEQWTSGRPMKKDSQKAGNSVFGRQRSNRNSDVSLPSAGSIHSSLSTDSEFVSFTVSALDALAPRPTLRYTRGHRSSPPPQLGPLQSVSQKRRLVDNEPIPEATMRAHKRIDSLADNLDASDLRELMERDKRRRDKKKQKERSRMERRLAKRAEEQKAEEIESRKTGTPPPENLERGVMGRELVGLGIEPASAVVTSSKQRDSSESERMGDADDELEDDCIKRPIVTFHSTHSVDVLEDMIAEQQPIEEPKPSFDLKPAEEQPIPMDIDTPHEGSVITRPSEDHPSSLYSTRLAGILRSVKSRSKSTLRSERDKMVSPPPDTIREESRRNSQDSGSSVKSSRFSIRGFLSRFGSRRRRNSNKDNNANNPSSFANTSREEMQAVAAAVRAKAQAQAQALARLDGDDFPVYLSRKPSSGVPKRTRSRFREDLPELPISPPASPEPVPPVPTLHEEMADDSEVAEQSEPEQHSMDIPRRNSSVAERAYVTPSPEAQLSTSLASIDSEGSWLSGNKDARKVAMRNSLRRANRRAQGPSETPTHNSTEDEIVGDEYLLKLTPARTPSKRETGHLRELGQLREMARPSSDENDLGEVSDLKWGTVGTQPRLVQAMMLKSQEGLLDMESEMDDSEASPISPVSPSSEVADLQRATSVNLGKGHVRNFSAGSAKLLELTPRLSGDHKAGSEKRNSNPMVL